MALLHTAAMSSSPPCRSFRSSGATEGRSRYLPFLSVKEIVRIPNGSSLAIRFPSDRGEVSVRARLKLVEAPPALEKGQTRSSVEIPVTCYQILGVSEKAEKDEIVKAAMELKSSEIEDGYTGDAIVSRQDLLVDVRDKLLFEPQYAGDLKEKVSPKSSIRIPWTWLPAALCLLQEVGEEKFVLEIGRAALQLPDVKPYVHDVLLSMALSECSIAKVSLEKGKVSEGFEALARAQYLLKGKPSLGKMALLSQIEESLEELAPACTLELLGIPRTPDNVERRQGAIAALRELLRQGLDAEASCRIQDWACFLSQAMSKLLATEVVDLLSWDTLVINRKNKKSLESQNQRVVIDSSCFYVAMIAHIALGFSTRQIDMISKAKTICECLIASEGMDFKFEEAFCCLLLGQGGETAAVVMLRQLEINGSPVLRSSESTTVNKEHNDKGTMNRLLETWLKDAVLCMFPDTRDSPPYLADFFRGPKQHKTANFRTSSSFSPSPDQGSSIKQLHLSSAGHLGEAVKKLAPANNLHPQLTLDKAPVASSSPSMKRNRGLELKICGFIRNMTGKIAYAMLAGCFAFATFKFLRPRYHTFPRSKNQYPGLENTFESKLSGLLAIFRKYLENTTNTSNDCSATACTALHKRQMPLEEAEAMVKQWQDAKAEALGPSHQIETLCEVLDESMLSKWHDLANLAKARSCFWRFVLLELSIMRANVWWDEAGNEMAEIVALLEEAAELVDESQPKKPSYYGYLKYLTKKYLKKHNVRDWLRVILSNKDRSV